MRADVPVRRWNAPYMMGAAAPNLDTYDDAPETAHNGLFGDDIEGTWEEAYHPARYTEDPLSYDDDQPHDNAIHAEYYGYDYASHPQRRKRTHTADGMFARDWYNHDGWHDDGEIHAPALLPSRAPRRATPHIALDAMLTLPRMRPWTILFLLIGVVVAGGLVSTGKMFDFKADSSAPFRYLNVGGVTDIKASDVEAAAKAAIATGSHNVVGKPTITPDKIDAVLRSYNSPAAGSGKAFYDLGVKYGIDPAYALAFFVQESTAGTKGVAATSKSLGNIRWTQGCGFANVSGYRGYGSWEQGAEDWYKLIGQLYVGGWGLSTVEKIVPVYAPSGDNNNPASYVRVVTSLVDGWRAER